MTPEKDNLTPDQQPMPGQQLMPGQQPQPDQQPFPDQQPVPDRTSPTPPPVKREFEVEEEWAETLGMNFDPEEVKRRAETPEAPQPPRYSNQPPQTPPPAPAGPGAPQPPIEPLRPPMPPTYLVWAILATLCCCLPAGIVAIIYSANVSSKYYAADYEGASRTSRNAEIWIIVSIVLGIITNALYLPLTLLMPS